MIYLATPYSHPSLNVREQRFANINKVAADMMRDGQHVFSPISHTHPIALAGELPMGWEFWEAYDRRMLAACDSVLVVCQRGWYESVGVQAEIHIAKELGKTVEYTSHAQ